MTPGELRDVMVGLAEGQGYKRSQLAFDFDNTPDQRLDKSFYLNEEREAAEGYIGGDQNETHRYEVFFAIKTKRDGWGAARQMTADLAALEIALLNGEILHDYHVDEDTMTTRVSQDAQVDFVIGRLFLSIEIDRDLT